MTRLLEPRIKTPYVAAAVGIVLVESFSSLPSQIRWADELGRVSPETPLWARLRHMTVPPTLLYNEDSGWSAALDVVLWTGLFAFILITAARAVAGRAALPPERSAVFCLALIVFAPLANVVAQILPEVTVLLTEPVQRGELLTRVLWDAQESSAHALYVTAVTVVCVTVAGAAWRRGSTEPGAGNEERRPRGRLRDGLLSLFLVLRGPEHTLWRRIGLCLLLTCGASALMKLLSSASYEGWLSLIVAPLCHSDGMPALCSEQLGSALFGYLPNNHGPVPRVSPVFYGYAALYALQGFALSFALCTFFLASTGMLRRTPAATLLASWSGYLLGTLTYGVLLELGLRMAEGRTVSFATLPELLPSMLLPPESLAHMLFAAPTAATLLALCHLALAHGTRFGRGGTAAGSGDGVTPDRSREPSGGASADSGSLPRPQETDSPAPRPSASGRTTEPTTRV